MTYIAAPHVYGNVNKLHFGLINGVKKKTIHNLKHVLQIIIIIFV